MEAKRSTTYVYPVVFTPYDGGYTVAVPDLLGCVTGGATIEESMELIEDALAGCLCTYEDKQAMLDPPRALNEIPIDEPEAFASLVCVNTGKYRAETDIRDVRTNVTIPS